MSTTSLFVESVLVALYANTEALLVAGAGVFAVANKIVSGPDLKILARLLVKILFPLFTFSNFRIYSVDKIAAWYVASICSILFMAIGALMGWLAGCLFGLRAPYSKMLVLSTTFGNVGALPYVLIPPIVSNWQLVSSQREENLLKGFAIIALFAGVWGLVLFSAGQRYALSMAPKQQAAAGEGTGATAVLAPRSRLCTAVACIGGIEPVILGSMIGIIIGCIEPLKALLDESGPLRFIGAFSYRLGSSGIPLSTMVLGGSLGVGGKSLLASRRTARAERKKAATSASAVAAQSEEGAVASDAPAQAPPPPMKTGEEAEMEGEASSTTTATATRGGTTTSVAVQLDDQPSHERRLAVSLLSPMQRLIIAAVLVKLVVMPAVAIPLTLQAARANILPNEPMLLVIVMIQSGVPSAQTSLALLVAAGLQKEASELSLVYLPMYIVSIFTMGVVVFAAVQSVGELQAELVANATLSL